MSVVAAGLGDQQIADVAAWYAAQTVEAVPPAGFDPAAAPEVCPACHGADGIAVIPEAPNLAGENTIYLDTQLKAFRAGKRASDIMGPVAADLDDAQIRAIAEWYASIGLRPVARLSLGLSEQGVRELECPFQPARARMPPSGMRESIGNRRDGGSHRLHPAGQSG